jgi:NADPH:quinone reductase-like Zn-dependent oxidoreductase
MTVAQWHPAEGALAAPSEMSAVRIARHGPPEVLELWRGPVPDAGPGEALVAVAAAGVNPVDAKTRAGGGVAALNPLPTVLGWDLAGHVVAVGEGVDALWLGERVCGLLRFPRPAGCYAEYVAAPVAELARAPRSIDLGDAAGLPLAGLTALQALTEHGRVLRGDRVLVHAGAGGVGHLAVQVAKVLGAHVTATASAANLDYLRELGADEAIDYRARPFERGLEKVAVAVDPVGGEVGRRSLATLRPGGTLVALSDDPDQALAAEHGVEAKRIRVHPDAAGLDRLARLVDSGRLGLTVAARLPLQRAGEAHELVQSGHLRGKALLTVGAG